MNDKYSDIEGMLFLFNQLHEESQKEREKKEKECNDIDILIKDYPVFEESQKKKCLLYSKSLQSRQNENVLLQQKKTVKKAF